MIIVKLVNDIEVNEQQTTDVLVLVFLLKNAIPVYFAT